MTTNCSDSVCGTGTSAISTVDGINGVILPATEIIIEKLAQQVELSHLAQSLRSRIELITDLQNGLTQVNSLVANETSILAQELLALRNELNGAVAYIDNQTNVSISERQSLVTNINTLMAQFGTHIAALQEQTTVLAEDTGALLAEKTIKVDLAGNVAGYGLSARVDPQGQFTSDFQVRADTFSIAGPTVHQSTAPANPYDGMVWVDTSNTPPLTKWFNGTTQAWGTTPVKGAVPFIVKTSPETIDGVTIDPGVYINSAYISRLTADQIDTRNLTVRDANGNVILGAGTNLDWSKITGDGKPEAGATRNVFRGNWATDTSYYVGDTVMDALGYGWICVANHSSSNTITTPTYPTQANSYWQLYLLKGDKGENGTNGLAGPPGQDGKVFYTWVKYADSPTTGMSDYPDGKAYLGIAYNKETATESTNYSDYTWAKIQGEQGVPGVNGTNGVTTYTWIKYADSVTGTGMSDSPTGKTYVGLAVNKTTATESTNAADYTWSLIKGDTGPQGPTGPTGPQGLTGPKGDTGVGLNSSSILTVASSGTLYVPGIRVGDLNWNTSGERTSGKGLALTPTGLLGHNGSKTTFTINAATGDATFAGTLSGAIVKADNVESGAINTSKISANAVTVSNSASGVTPSFNLAIPANETVIIVAIIIASGGETSANRLFPTLRITIDGVTYSTSVDMADASSEFYTASKLIPATYAVRASVSGGVSGRNVTVSGAYGTTGIAGATTLIAFGTLR